MATGKGKKTKKSLAAVVLASAGATAASAQMVAAPGWSFESQALPSGVLHYAGLCRLPSGLVATFDGQKVVAIDPAPGGVLSILHQVPSPVFGAFLLLDPTGSALWLGESSNGTILRIPLDGSPAQTVATIPLCYDAAFDAAGRLFLAHGYSTWTGTDIVLLDLATGASDVIASLPGPSGPLAFLPDGRLVYGENSVVFPAPPGSAALEAFAPTQLQSAIGSTFLTLADAEILGSGFDVISDLAVDAEGDLILADSVYGRLVEFDPLTAGVTLLGSPSGGATFGATAVEFVDPGARNAATFEPFQPSPGGWLSILESDFSGTTILKSVRPLRPALAASPDGAIPIGPFTLELADAPPLGLAFLFGALGSQPELPSIVYGTPFFFGLAPGSMFSLATLPIDAGGAFVVPVANPGLGLTVYLQVAVIEGSGLPRGTSQVLPLALD